MTSLLKTIKDAFQKNQKTKNNTSTYTTMALKSYMEATELEFGHVDILKRMPTCKELKHVIDEANRNIDDFLKRCDGDLAQFAQMLHDFNDVFVRQHHIVWRLPENLRENLQRAGEIPARMLKPLILDIKRTNACMLRKHYFVIEVGGHRFTAPISNWLDYLVVRTSRSNQKCQRCKKRYKRVCRVCKTTHCFKKRHLMNRLVYICGTCKRKRVAKKKKA